MRASPIHTLALQAGFDALGVARLTDDSPQAQYLIEWLNKEYHGQMTYLERGAQKRLRPSLVLENGKTILCLKVDYSQASLTQNTSSIGIARYVLQEDYHETIGRKLKDLVQSLQQHFPNHQFKPYVDTGPILEKHWSAQAGLGWIGKHTNLIHPKEGSYFFLAVILTDLELEPDLPMSDHCGKCTACLQICPTQAIVAPYVLDARRCISYLTIELKGPIPHEFRTAIGTHVFGCDDCQEVCPWNRHARLPEDTLRHLDLKQLHDFLYWNDLQFKKYFQGSPVLRTKRRGFLRNVCVVLGNLGNMTSIDPLRHALKDSESLIRGHAAWALGCFKTVEVLQSLKDHLLRESDEWVYQEVQKALQSVSSKLK